MPAALDLAVTGGLKGDMVQRSAENCSTVVTTYEDFKRSYLAKRHLPKGGFKLYPSDMRGWGPTANAVWSELAKYKSVLTGKQNSTTATRLLKSLGLILLKEIARAILRQSPITINRDFGE